MFWGHETLIPSFIQVGADGCREEDGGVILQTLSPGIEVEGTWTSEARGTWVVGGATNISQQRGHFIARALDLEADTFPFLEALATSTHLPLLATFAQKND